MHVCDHLRLRAFRHFNECGTLHCLVSRFNNAMATIRRVPALDHNFQLVIKRVYEDEDEELIEDEEESMHSIQSYQSDCI